MKIVLATNSADKMREFEKLWGNDNLIQISPGIEVEETGNTFIENATLKAQAYAAKLNIPALGDDSGLCVDALDGRPGLYSARYAPNAEQKMARLLDEMKDIPDEKRGAFYVCALCLAFPDGRLIQVQAEAIGEITREPRGKFGFDYDPLFLTHEFGLTYGQIGETMKSQVSHRARAVAKIKELILRPVS